MKKILFSVFIGLSGYWVIGLLAPSPVSAAPCPPLGTNIAANFDRENLEWIAQNANCAGPIPITVIITPAMVQNPDILIDVQNNLRELNFNPTWRPWGNGMPQGDELQSWINAASVLTIGQLQLFNEPNNCYRGCYSGSTPDPVADARAALAFLEASRQGVIKVPLALMPLSPRTPNYGPFMSEQNYWTQFNNACEGCVEDFDYIGLNVYPLTSPGAGPNVNIQGFINDFTSRVNFFANLGVNTATTRFVIVEAGLDPGMYQGNFEQRVRDTIAFAQALEEYVLVHPGEFPNLDQINFLLMNDDTGEQFLIYRHCDESGCEWRVTNFLAFNYNVPGVPISGYPSLFESLTCEYQAVGDRDSRPHDCDPCNATNNFCSSCATSFTVFDKVKWQRKEIPDEVCEEEDWKRTPWEGSITIDPTQTTIPFVGKKREDDINKREDEQKYLADYFDGTHEYYRSYDVQIAGKTIYHGTNTTLLPNYQGVLRKLTPMEYQDELKKEMVQRAQEASSTLKEGNIHNYNVAYKPRLCWDFSFFGDAAIGFANSIAGSGVMEISPIDASKLFSFLASISHYCLYNFTPATDDLKITTAKGAIDAFNVLISSLGPLGDLFKIQTEGKIDGVEKPLADLVGHFPPEPDEEEYTKKWQEWKKSEWGRLWEAVPMVSREDTPGMIFPYLGSKPDDTFTINNPDAQIEKVPHVARLYESSQKIQSILLPSTGGGLTSQKETGPIIASPANGRVQGEKVLLVQGCPEIECPTISIVNPSYSNRFIYYTVVIKPICPQESCLGDYWLGPCYEKRQMVNICPPYGFSTNHTHLAPPVPISCPGTAIICSAYLSESSTQCPGCWGTWQSAQCTVEVDDTCTIINTNCGAAGPPAPTCGLPEALPVNKCELTAIADTNPNDNLCCKKIDIKLDAVDMFTYVQVDCSDFTCGPFHDQLCPDDPCLDWEKRDVNREIGINLSHPYLTPIWEQTAKSEANGIFNIFRPAQIPQFEDLDASSEITYSYCKKSILGICTEKGTVIPETGEFYFNHLGGVQKAKEWVTTKVLMPYVEQ